MFSNLKTHLLELGFLRQGLFLLAVATMLLPTIEWLVIQSLGELDKYSILAISAGLIAPIMAPILIVLILLDVIMSKVRVADDAQGEGVRYRVIIRLEVVLMLAMLAFWIPFFISLTP